MKRYPALFIKWLANRFGYKIGMIKIDGNNKQFIEFREVYYSNPKHSTLT